MERKKKKEKIGGGKKTEVKVKIMKVFKASLINEPNYLSPNFNQTVVIIKINNSDNPNNTSFTNIHGLIS